MIRVVVVDDQPLIRAAVTTLLEAEADLDVVGHAADGIEALALIEDTEPDIALVDIRMPHMDGIQTTSAISANPRMSATRVLILTTFEEDAYVLSALRAGASGFIGKSAEPDEITRAIRAAHAGDALLTPVATRALIERFLKVDAHPSTGPSHQAQLALLTTRETEVLTRVARGRSNQELADELFISPATAKTHVNRILGKLGLRDRTQLVIFAYEAALIRPGSGRHIAKR